MAVVFAITIRFTLLINVTTLKPYYLMGVSKTLIGALMLIGSLQSAMTVMTHVSVCTGALATDM